MAGLGPAIHVFVNPLRKTWMPGTSPGMTEENSARSNSARIPLRSMRAASEI